MNDVTARNRLAEHKWKLYNTADMGLLPDGQVARYIEGIAHKEVDSLVQFLERFVSVTNYDADDSIRYAYVTAPLIDNQPKAGNWRAVQVRTERVDVQGRVGPDGSTFRIIQVLAEGFLTALAGSDARLIQGRSNTGDTGSNAGAEYLTLEWVGVDPDVMKSLADGKLSTSVISGLTYRKVQHDGTAVTVALGDDWHCLASSWELAQDGSGTVRFGVAKPEYTLEGFSNWLGSRQGTVTQYFDVPEALAQSILDAAKSRGADARATSYNREQGLISLTVTDLDLSGVLLNNVKISESCDETVTASFAWGVAGNSLTGVTVTGSGTTGANTQYKYSGLADGKPYYLSDTSYRIQWSLSNMRWELRSNTSSLLYINANDGEFPYLGGTWTVSSGSLPVPSLFASSFEVLPIPDTIPAGTSYDRNLSENGDGSFSIVLRKRTRRYRDITEYDSEFRADRDAKRKEWKGVTNQDLGTALNGQAGKIVQVRKDFRDDCSVDITRDVITPENQTNISGDARDDQTSVITENTQADSALATPSPTVGKIKRVRNRETEFGKFNTTNEEITAVAQSVTHDSQSRADQTASRVVETNAAVKADASGGGSGTIVTAQSRKNEFGLYDNQVETVTAEDQTSYDAETRSDRTIATEKHTQADAEASAARGAGETNKIIRVRNQETEFGLHRTEREVITAVPQLTTHDSEDRADRSTSRTVATNAVAKADAPTAAAGEWTRARSQENEFGLFDNEVETVTAKDQTTTHSSQSRADQTASRTVARNALAKANASGGGSGTIVNARSQENEFGRFDNEIETVTSVNQTSTSYENGPHLDVNVVENTHSTVEADPGTPSVGTYKRVRNRATEFGDFETSVITETLSPTDTGWFDCGDNKSGQIQKRVATGQTEANAKAIAGSAPATGSWFTNGNVSGPDKFGTYSAVVVATEKQVGYSSTVPYKSYSFTVTGKKTQYRTKDGATEKRTLTVTYHYVGDTQEADIENYFEAGGTGANCEDVRINPNGTGEYFQGFGYTIDSWTAWTADESAGP